MATSGRNLKDTKEDDYDYDGDEFEKDDIVNMVEPRKPTIANSKKDVRSSQQVKNSRLTNDTGSDSNSLLAEISLRNKAQEHSSVSGSQNLPSLK